MNGKKTELVGFRLSLEEKDFAEKICAEFGQTPGAIAGVLFERFLKQRVEHGNRLIWPPEFDHYLSDTQTERKKSES